MRIVNTNLNEIKQAENGGSGGDAVAGYEYQIDVSVWLALDLILANKLTQELILEPASQEDIEAELKEDEPGRVTSTVSLDGYKLVVQAKLRSGDAWSVSGVTALLKYGSDTRKSAAERLTAPEIRYLLITSAALNGGTRGLRVRRAGSWPKPADTPSTIVKALPSGAPGRVAIIGNQDEERLATDIKQLLTESFRVPNTRWKECQRELREEARIRISRGGSGSWKRAELERVIRNHEGYIASSPELDLYVHPTNWSDLRSAMRDRHSALIIGQSGTGKTMATNKLYEELRAEIPGLARVRITLGPQQLRDDLTESPVLYDIEDPWGRFDFDPGSRPWNDQLAQFFSHASHSRMVVATSRLDVAQSAGALEGVKPWMVALEAEHYGNRERRKLYQTRIDGLPHELQAVAAQAEKTVLAELATPLEIQKFFDALPAIDRQALKNPTGFISEAIRRAHQNSIERTVIEQIEEREDVRAAAIVWALLKANDKLSLRVLRTIEEGLADREVALSEGVSPLIAFFVAARNLRQNEDTVTYYHPRVESGIEQTLARDKHVLVTRRTFRLLIDVLTSLDGPDEAWGTAVAARLLAAADKKPKLKPSPASGAQAKIDAWLAAQVAEGGREFEANLQLAASAGSSASNVSEVARYLLHRPNQSWPSFIYWGPPQHDEAWYALVRSDPATKPLIETFIREVLPTVRDNFPKSFATEVERLAPGLSGAFLVAAARTVHYGYISSDDAIAEGALADLNGFEAIVDTAVQVLTPSEEERLQTENTHLAIINGEYSDDYAQHLSENDDGYTAHVFLEAYVDRVRRIGSWRSLAQHRHSDHLMSYWLRDLAKKTENAAPDVEEVAGAFTASHGSKHEADLWFVLLRTWECRYLEALTTRIIEGHQVPDVRRAALACLAEHAPDQLAEISLRLIAQGGQPRLVEVAIDIAYLRNRLIGDGERHGQAASAALTLLPALYIELSEADLALAENKIPVLSIEARVLLETIRDGSEDVRRLRVLLDIHMSLPIDDDVRWLLANTNDVDIAVKAVEAAIRRGMTADIDAALDHKFADVCARAMTAIATPMPAPLPERFLSKAKTKGSPIRQALVKLLDVKPHVAHLPTLLLLVKDTWSKSSASYGEADDFPIAQTAVTAIEKMAPVALDQAEQLYGVAIETSDPDLRSSLFKLLVRKSGSTFQERLFELAVNPGRLPVRQAATYALLQAGEVLVPELIAQITPELLATRVEPVAVNLTLLFAWRAEVKAICLMAEVLATNRKRRVLLLLMIWLVKDRDTTIAQKLAGMLPSHHSGVAWALGEKINAADVGVLADLGDPVICAQVFHYMKPKKE
jgi:hypothetical protein